MRIGLWRSAFAGALVLCLASMAFAVPQVWTWANGSTTVTKDDYADWSDPANQDRITDNVWLARRDIAGLYNARWEAPAWQGYPSSPVNTEWAYGNTDDWATLDFKSWTAWSEASPSDIVDQDAVLHLIDEDAYVDIRFTSWTSGAGGGGFSYDRATEGVSGEKVWTGAITTFTKEDYADWTLPENQDALTPNTVLTRQDSQGLFNIAKTSGFFDDLGAPFSPYDTEWAFGSAVDWESLEFTSWYDLDSPPYLVDEDLVVHLISDDIYLDIRLTSWTQGGLGGGFSYERATAAVPEPATLALVGLGGLALLRRRK